MLDGGYFKERLVLQIKDEQIEKEGYVNAMLDRFSQVKDNVAGLLIVGKRILERK